MLIENYLSIYHFNELHMARLNCAVDNIYEKMLQTDLRKSTLIKILFKLRGIPIGVHSINQLTDMGFIKLDEEPGKEIVFGMVTDHPMFNTCQPNISSKEFIQNTGNIIKAVINFKLENKSNSQHIISTETRIWCGSNELKSKFKYYWFFIKPFSQLIRKLMLTLMKQQILNATKMKPTPA